MCFKTTNFDNNFEGLQFTLNPEVYPGPLQTSNLESFERIAISR